MKNFKAGMILGTALLTSALVLGACGKKNEKDSAKGGEIPTLSLFGGDSNVGVYQGDWPVYKKPADELGFKMKASMPKTSSDYPQEFNLMMASGKVSDIVKTERNNFFKYGPEGAFEPLEDLIDKYAPNLKKFYEENPKVKALATGPDGHMWFVPFVLDGKVNYEWYLRQDWLDKLNLPMPDTVDDLYKTLTAFKTQDPNGNGKQDEVPYFQRGGIIGIRALLPLWGAHQDLYIEDGKVKMGELQPEYETAFKNIHKWYEEGLIDKEIYTRKNARDVLLTDNLGGATHDTSSASAYNKDLADKIPGFRLNPMAPPINVNGERVESMGKDFAKEYGVGISAENPEKEKTIKWIDYFYTEQGRMEANFGVEGKTFDVVDGKPKIKQEIIDSDVPTAKPIREVGGQTSSCYYQMEWEGQEEPDPVMEEMKAKYESEGWIEEAYPKLTFTEEEQKQFQKIRTQIDTYTEETTQQWVLGSQEINFESFKKEMKSRGVDDLLKLEQKAYDRYVKEIKEIEEGK